MEVTCEDDETEGGECGERTLMLDCNVDCVGSSIECTVPAGSTIPVGPFIFTSEERGPSCWTVMWTVWGALLSALSQPGPPSQSGHSSSHRRREDPHAGL